MMTKEQFATYLKGLNVYRITISATEQQKFAEVYNSIFEQLPPCAGCPNEVEMALHKMQIYCDLLLQTKHTTIVKANQLMQYTMKEGVVIFSNTLNMMVSSFNCTDAVAELLIKENASNLQFFTHNVDAGKTYTTSNVEQTSVTEKETIATPTIEKQQAVKATSTNKRKRK